MGVSKTTEPGAVEVLAYLRHNSPYLTELVDQFHSGISAMQRSARNILEGGLLQRLNKIATPIMDITVEDYATFVGTFNHLRITEESYDLRIRLLELAETSKSDTAKQLLVHLLPIVEGAWTLAEKRHEEVYGNGKSLFGKFTGKFSAKKPDLSYSQRFASDCLLLLRTIYPAGVNMTSPEWNDEVVSHDCRCDVTLRMLKPGTDGNMKFHDSIEITPYGDTVSMVSYKPSHPDIESRLPVMLNDGESLMIGRNLGIKELFGLRRRKEPILLVRVKGQIDDPNVSRAGLMIFRLRNKLYLFNRGSMNNYSIEESQGGVKLTCADFSGGTVMDESGHHSFGSSNQTVFGTIESLDLSQFPEKEVSLATAGTQLHSPERVGGSEENTVVEAKSGLMEGTVAVNMAELTGQTSNSSLGENTLDELRQEFDQRIGVTSPAGTTHTDELDREELVPAQELTEQLGGALTRSSSEDRTLDTPSESVDDVTLAASASVVEGLVEMRQAEVGENQVPGDCEEVEEVSAAAKGSRSAFSMFAKAIGKQGSSSEPKEVDSSIQSAEFTIVSEETIVGIPKRASDATQVSIVDNSLVNSLSDMEVEDAEIIEDNDEQSNP